MYCESRAIGFAVNSYSCYRSRHAGDVIWRISIELNRTKCSYFNQEHWGCFWGISQNILGYF